MITQLETQNTAFRDCYMKIRHQQKRSWYKPLATCEKSGEQFKDEQLYTLDVVMWLLSFECKQLYIEKVFAVPLPMKDEENQTRVACVSL